MQAPGDTGDTWERVAAEVKQLLLCGQLGLVPPHPSYRAIQAEVDRGKQPLLACVCSFFKKQVSLHHVVVLRAEAVLSSPWILPYFTSPLWP